MKQVCQEMWIYQAGFIDYSWRIEKYKRSKTHRLTTPFQLVS